MARDQRIFQRLLMKDVAGNGDQVGLRISNVFVARDTEQPQKNLLREVPDVGRVAHASGEERTNSLAVPYRQVSNEAAAIRDHCRWSITIYTPRIPR